MVNRGFGTFLKFSELPPFFFVQSWFLEGSFMGYGARHIGDISEQKCKFKVIGRTRELERRKHF